MAKPITVCIVEDIPEIRAGLEKIIQSSGAFQWLASFNEAEKAIENLPALKPDIVIMDINLPDMNGIECIRQVSTTPDIQFIMFTIYENNELVFDALAAGASGYLLKNTPPDKILEALMELHHGGSPMSAHIARKVVASFQKSPEADKSLSLLTNRERQALECLAKGYLYKEIADKLGISTGTVRQHIHKIYEKLHVHNRTEAINKVYGKG